MKNYTCVGLFGTCDNSTWRVDFINAYKLHKIDYFNPDAGDNWHPGLIEEENKHLMEDDIILFPVLAESLGLGSLGEIGFSVLNSIRNIQNGSGQHLIAMIDDDCTDERKTEVEREHSVKVRRFVKSKLIKVEHPNILVVKNMDDMLNVSVKLHGLLNTQRDIRNVYNITA